MTMLDNINNFRQTFENLEPKNFIGFILLILCTLAVYYLFFLPVSNAQKTNRAIREHESYVDQFLNHHEK